VTADKFLINSLKNFAFTNLAHWAESHWDSSVFPEIVHEMIMSELPHESLLRDMVVGVISKNIFSLVQQRETLELVDDLNLVWIIEHLVERDRVRPVVEEPNHELLALANKLNLNHWCRHCSAKFHVKMQPGEYQKLYSAVPLAEHGIELRRRGVLQKQIYFLVFCSFK
jgi:hypothetical protein